MSAARPVTSTLAPAPGERIELDLLAGAAPGYLFLHGLGTGRHGEKSDALLQHAAARGRAAARFDFRGHGGSSGQIGAVTFSELLQDAGAVLDRLGRAVVLGSSLGGLVAAHLAARRPDDVVGLCLLSPALGFLPRMRGHVAADGTMATPQGVRFAVQERALIDAARHDETNLPLRLPMPVLLAHGTLDDIVPPVLSEAFFAAIPHDRKDLWIIDGGDHRLNAPFPAILERLEALLGRCGVA